MPDESDSRGTRERSERRREKSRFLTTKVVRNDKRFRGSKDLPDSQIYEIHKSHECHKKECRNAPGCAGRNSRKGSPMYSGTLIDDLIATVEQAETSFRLEPEQESKLAYWYAVARTELAKLDGMNHQLAGVA
jgi:hypothetical protein